MVLSPGSTLESPGGAFNLTIHGPTPDPSNLKSELGAEGGGGAGGSVVLRHQSFAKLPVDSHLQTGRESLIYSMSCLSKLHFVLKLCCCCKMCVCYASQGMQMCVALEAKLPCVPPPSTHTLEVMAWSPACVKFSWPPLFL